MSKQLLILSTILIFFSGIIEAAIINVPEDHETIQAGIEAAEVGDTVLVSPGEYVENIRYLGKDIVVASLILITGDEAYIDSTIIDGDQQGSVVQFYERVTSYAKLSGFTIQNGSGTSFGFGEHFGGGIFILGSDVVIEHCRIRDNHVESVFGEPSGGGIACYGYVEDAHPTIRDCEVYNNSSDGDGGGIAILAGCNPEIRRVSISDNTALSGGGVSIISECNVIMEYCIISGNTAAQVGGGIKLVVASTVELLNVTITGNSAEIYGGGLISISEGQINSLNTIFWNNDPEEIYFTGETDPSSITIGFSNIDGGEEEIVTNDNAEVEWTEGNIDADPLFVDAENGDFHLTADSPCVDAGNPDDDNDPDGTRADMGAYYFHQRDIDVNPVDVHFPAIPWGELDSLPVNIVNTGGTVLSITDIVGALCQAHVGLGGFDPDDLPFMIEPADTLILYAYNHPDPRAVPECTAWIVSDDPDEPEIEIIMVADVLSVDEEENLPISIELFAAYPNPFNNATKLSFSLPVVSRVMINVINIHGDYVATLSDAVHQSGQHTVSWDASGMPSGIYFARMEAGGFSQTVKLMLMK